MAVLTSRMAAALDALIALATANLTGVAIVDGPFNINDTETALAAQRLFVGADDASGLSEAVAVDGDQAFRTMGARQRDEHFTVHCVAEGSDGDGVMKAARDAAVAVLAGMELLLRPTQANTQAYTVSGTVLWAGIGHESITQEWTTQGAYCRVNFAIDCRSNLNQ